MRLLSALCLVCCLPAFALDVPADDHRWTASEWNHLSHQLIDIDEGRANWPADWPADKLAARLLDQTAQLPVDEALPLRQQMSATEDIVNALLTVMPPLADSPDTLALVRLAACRQRLQLLAQLTRFQDENWLGDADDSRFMRIVRGHQQRHTLAVAQTGLDLPSSELRREWLKYQQIALPPIWKRLNAQQKSIWQTHWRTLLDLETDPQAQARLQTLLQELP